MIFINDTLKNTVVALVEKYFENKKEIPLSSLNECLLMNGIQYKRYIPPDKTFIDFICLFPDIFEIVFVDGSYYCSIKEEK